MGRFPVSVVVIFLSLGIAAAGTPIQPVEPLADRPDPSGRPAEVQDATRVNATNGTAPPVIDPSVGASRVAFTADHGSLTGQYVVIARLNESVNVTAVASLGTVGTVAAGRAEVRTTAAGAANLRTRPWVLAVRPTITTEPSVSPPAPAPANVSELGADRVHRAGTRGEGIAVGVISVGGFQTDAASYRNQIAGTRNFGSRPFDDNVAHDTAATEQLAETAPGARLFLAAVETEVDFAAAIDWMIANDVDVILTESNFYVTPPGGGGFVAEQTDRATAAGIVVVSAGGNSRLGHYQAPFSDPDGDGWHNFDGSVEGNRLGGANASLDGGVRLLLTWSDFGPGPNSNYDLYLFNPRSETVVAAETGLNPEVPVETLEYRTDGPEPLSVLIRHEGGDRSDIVQAWFTSCDTCGLEYVVPVGSVVPPASASTALAVGAYDLAADRMKPYSAEGPINGHEGIDVVSPTDLPASPYAAGFSGTSGAAPYVAGTVALLLSANGSLTPGQIERVLETTADQVEYPPRRAGGGFINETAAVRAVTAPVRLHLTANRTAVSPDAPVGFVVTDGAGTPVENATIQVAGTAHRTDRSGRVTVRLTSTGTYMARASKSGVIHRYVADTVTVDVVSPTPSPRPEPAPAPNPGNVSVSVASAPSTVLVATNFSLTITLSNEGETRYGAGQLTVVPPANVTVVDGPATRLIPGGRAVEPGEAVTMTFVFRAERSLAGETVTIAANGSLFTPTTVATTAAVTATVRIDGAVPAHLSVADRNGDGRIDRGEVGQAIAAFNTGTAINGAVPTRTRIGQTIAWFNRH